MGDLSSFGKNLQRGTPGTRRQPITFGWALVAVVISIAFYRTAWVAEDAFITFRVVDNVLQGLGPVWNPGDRVQVYTHPLWFGLLIPAVAISGDPYFSSIILSFLLLSAALGLSFSTIGRQSMPALMIYGSLVLSKAFIDYASSGLETPLLYALLALVLHTWVRLDGKARLRRLSIIASALFLTRPDAILLIAPGLTNELWKCRRHPRDLFKCVLPGFAPALAWTVFSIFYYGSPMPNTALAKAFAGLDAERNFLQAGAYLTRCVVEDPHTILLIGLGCLSPLSFRSRDLLPFALGILLWIAYLFQVGGDYMAGRFLSFPAFLAVGLIAVTLCRASPDASRRSAWLILGLIITNAGSLDRTLLSGAEYSTPGIDQNGIADERGFYFQKLGMVPTLRRGSEIDHSWAREGRMAASDPGVYIRCTVGMAPYFSGHQVRWIDPLALTDAFLARLPARTDVRVGHYERSFPKGFLESEVLGENLVADPELRSLYGDVVLATRAPLYDPRRIGAVWRLNTGTYRAAVLGHARDAPPIPGHLDQPGISSVCTDIGRQKAETWKVDAAPVALRSASDR